MSTADEINLKRRAVWPIVESLREKFDQALNEQIDNVVLSSWPLTYTHKKWVEAKVKPFPRRAGPQGRRLSLKRRKAWVKRVFTVKMVGDEPLVSVGKEWGAP